MRIPSAKAWHTVAWLVLIGCIACRRGEAQAELQVMNRPTAVSLSVGDTITVRAVVALEVNEAPVTVAWSSDNDAVARVDRDGHVTARAPGVTGITSRVGTAFSTTRVSVTTGPPHREATASVATASVAPATVAAAPPPRGAAAPS